MGVRGSVGRAGVGLLGVVVTALLISGVPASADPTASPSPSPSASTSTSGSPSPSASPTATAASDGAATTAGPDAAVEAHDTAELIAATQALEQAQADLVGARADLDTARAELATAKAADLAAQVDLETTAIAEQRAVRDLAAVRTRIVVHQTDLGRLASSAYRSNGALGEWSLVLGSDTPNQLADRLATLQSVASAGNAMIAGLDRDRADLTNAEAHLTATLEAQATARAPWPARRCSTRRPPRRRQPRPSSSSPSS